VRRESFADRVPFRIASEEQRWTEWNTWKARIAVVRGDRGLQIRDDALVESARLFARFDPELVASEFPKLLELAQCADAVAKFHPALQQRANRNFI